MNPDLSEETPALLQASFSLCECCCMASPSSVTWRSDLLWCTDRAKLQGGGLGEAVHGERPPGVVRSDVVLVRAAQRADHQLWGHEDRRRGQRESTERPPQAAKGRWSSKIRLLSSYTFYLKHLTWIHLVLLSFSLHGNEPISCHSFTSHVNRW